MSILTIAIIIAVVLIILYYIYYSYLDCDFPEPLDMVMLYGVPIDFMVIEICVGVRWGWGALLVAVLALTGIFYVTGMHTIISRVREKTKREEEEARRRFQQFRSDHSASANQHTDKLQKELEYTPSNNYSNISTSVRKSTATSTSVTSTLFKVNDQTDVILTGISVITKEIANMYPNLTNLTIGQGVNKIDAGAFCENARLEKVIIDTDIVEIGSYAFSNAEKLREVVGIDRVMEIGYKAFSTCSSLSIVRSTFKSSCLKTIGQEAFFKCENLSTVVLPNRPVIFAKACFSECEKLQSIGEVVYASAILNDAFLGCKSLKSFRFGNAPHTIGSYAFACCLNLEYMFIPEGTTSIGSNAFSACCRLETISFPRTITHMGGRVLECSLNELSSLTLPAIFGHRLNDILGDYNPDFIDLSNIVIKYI